MIAIRQLPLTEKMFELLDEKVFVFERALVEAGLSANYYRKAKSQRSGRLQFHSHPKDKRFTLVAYETISAGHQEKITARFGDPYEFIAKEPIRQLVQPDAKAEKFYLDHRYADNKSLPHDHVKKYSKAAAWLNTLIALNDDKKYIKSVLKISLEKFWCTVSEIIKVDEIEIPSNSRKLWARMKQYKEEGYSCLIDWRFGNKNSAKLGKSEEGFDEKLYQQQLAFILKAASMPNNYDAVQIANGVNGIFQMKGWPTVSDATVYNIINSTRHLTIAGARGKADYDNSISMHVKRSRPTAPLQFCTMDGWTAELVYQERTDKGQTYHNRLVLVVVLDAMNDYPLGYAIGDRENVELIREANRNAISHITEIFGGAYRPWQTQSDRFGIKANTNFFDAVSHLHIPARAHNAKAKVIEPYWNRINHNYCQYLPNWTGHNLNSKKSNQPNREYLDKIKNSFPDRDGVVSQLQSIIDRERRSKIEGYLTAWEALPTSERCSISPAQCLQILGDRHAYTNSITGEGLAFTLNGCRKVYDTTDPAFRALNHLPFQVYYNPNDLSAVLAVQEEKRVSFLLNEKLALPMDVRSMQPEHHRALKMIRDFNKARTDEVMQGYETREALVAEAMGGIFLNPSDDQEARLKNMFTINGQQKDGLQDAKGLKPANDQRKRIEVKAKEHENEWEKIYMNSIQEQTDIDKYL